MTLEIRLILVGVLMLAATSGVIYWNVHERHKGAAVCQNNDQQAAQTQLAKQAKDLASYQTQLGEAHEKLEDATKLLALAADAAVPHIMCHATAANSVPPVSGKASSGLAAPRPPDPVRERDFDPSAALQSLHVAYEQRVEECRDALNRWPQKPPPQR